MHWNQKFQEYLGRGFYTPQVMGRIHYDMMQRACVVNANIGQCPFCAMPLSQQDMHPQGRATRHLCGRCYQAIFQPVHTNCIICAASINHKVAGQRQNWRLIENHICDNDLCKSLWALGHGIVIGIAPWQSGWNFYLQVGTGQQPSHDVQARAQQMYQQGYQPGQPQYAPQPHQVPQRHQIYFQYEGEEPQPILPGQPQPMSQSKPKQIEAVPISDKRQNAIPHMQADTIDNVFDHGNDPWAETFDMQKRLQRILNRKR